jgi:hypothetical protein
LVVMGPGSRSLRSLVRDDEIDSIFKRPTTVQLEGRHSGMVR